MYHNTNVNDTVKNRPPYVTSAVSGLSNRPKNERAFNIMYSDELFTMKPKQFLIDGIIAKGDLVMLYGPSGSGKSFVVFDLLASAITGKAFAERFNIARPLNVLYLAGEGQGGIPGRFQAVMDKFNYPDTERRFGIAFDVPQLYDKNHHQYIDRLVDEYKQDNMSLDLLVIDTLATAVLGANENNNGHMGQAIASVRRAMERLDCSVIIVHHALKNGDSERGASALKAGCDAVYKVWRKRGGIRCFGCAKQRDGADFEDIAFTLESRGNSATVLWQSDQEAGKLTEDELAVKKALENSSKPMTTEEIATAIGREGQENAVRNILNRLAQKGRVQKRLKNPTQKQSRSNPYLYANA